MAYRECIVLTGENSKIGHVEVSLLKGGDIFFVICMFLVAFKFVTSRSEESTSVEIRMQNKVIHTLSLLKDTCIHENGVTVVVENYKAFVQQSNCPSQVCVKSGSIKRVGQTIICVPNGVVIQAKGENLQKNRRGIDAVAE